MSTSEIDFHTLFRFRFVHGLDRARRLPRQYSQPPYFHSNSRHAIAEAGSQTKALAAEIPVIKLLGYGWTGVLLSRRMLNFEVKFEVRQSQPPAALSVQGSTEVGMAYKDIFWMACDSTEQLWAEYGPFHTREEAEIEARKLGFRYLLRYEHILGPDEEIEEVR